MVRVTSGEVRGFKLEVPRRAAVRPPLEMLREAVFNIIGQDLEGWRVVDLFAGSGIMGIEALSRGARAAVFVEKDRAASAVITRNLEKTGFLDRADIITGNAFTAARRLEGKGPIDAVFIDPPFAMMREAKWRGRLSGLVAELFESGELDRDALVILRAPERTRLDAPEGLLILRERKYGHSRLFFIAKADTGGRDEAVEGAGGEPAGGQPPDRRAGPGGCAQG